MIRTEHQHFLIIVGKARATAPTLKGAECAKRTLLEDFYDGFKYKKPECLIIGPFPGPCSEAS